MKEYQVQPEGWAPFCEGQKLIFQNKVLVRMGKKYGKTVAQIILRFHIQRGVAVIPGSSKKEHIWENMDIWDFKLSETDMKAIDGNRQALTFVGTEDVSGFPKYFKLKDMEQLENSGVVLRYEICNQQ